MESPQKTFLIEQKEAIPFSISCLDYFLEMQLYNEKEVLWPCMKDLYDGLQQTRKVAIFK